jgi:hypothetical protein
VLPRLSYHGAFGPLLFEVSFFAVEPLSLVRTRSIRVLPIFIV